MSNYTRTRDELAVRISPAIIIEKVERYTARAFVRSTVGRMITSGEFDDEWFRFVGAFQSTAFRLETLQVYNEDHEREEIQAFLTDGSRPLYLEWARWLTELPRMAKNGRRVQRVHTVVEPLTDYVRYECAWGYRDSAPVGEDVRIIPVTGDAWPDGLPHQDFWLFDSVHLLDMTYGPDDSFVSAELVDDAERIAQANHWRDLALRLSVPYSEYERRFDQMMRPL